MHALIARTGHLAPALVDVARPAPRTDEILVRVHAAAVNPADVWVASGLVRDAFPLPDRVGLGYDLSGEVIQVGDGVRGLAVGDVVAALHADLAAPVRAHAELVTVPASAAARVPDGLDVVEAASVPLNALTAVQALDLLGEPAGRSLLVTGAAGAVGGYAVALAARAGWRVSALARPGDGEFLRRAGASAHLHELPGPEFDAVLDGAALQDAALGATKDGGAFVGVLPPVPVTPVRDVVVQEVFVHADGRRLADLLALSREGVLEIRVAGQLPLTEAQTAYDKLAGGGQRGRWLLLP